MVRYLLTFLTGAAAGALALFFFLREPTPPSRESGVKPARRTPWSTQPRPVAPAAPMAPAGIDVESAMEAEPPNETVGPVFAEDPLADGSIAIPVAGVRREELRDNFPESRGGRRHRAIDIAAARGTPVVAAIDGTVGKLFLSKPGGITLYQFDPAREWIYYYAHLEGYAPGIVEGKSLARGEVIGFVGTTGNAPPNAPHLHFAIEKLLVPGQWWKSEPVNPYPRLVSHGVTFTVERP
ncbi:MAG TPA: M23 family metallopeptidase [Thermoanaerobaculia bacterium]